MSVRLAFGVSTGPGSRCWAPTPAGPAVPVDGSGAHRPGAPVAVGPAGADSQAVEDAVGRLAVLVAGGADAAGAGVELGGGFTSARLAGAPGDRRDAVLAALRSLGPHGAHRLGDRRGVLVALFGLSATKRVGAAAEAAIVEGRWAALQLASAVSDLLGPEQLEDVLALRAPEGTDPFPRGAASTLAEHLDRVLSGYPRPRRVVLVASLWDRVCAHQLDRGRLARLRATQVRAERIDQLRERHRDHFDAALLQQVARALDGRPTLAAAARWRPPPWWAAQELGRLLHDAVAATALLRFARAVSDHGLAAASAEHCGALAAADACLDDPQRTAARHRGEGAHPHPARPGCYVHDVLQPLRSGRRAGSRTEAHVRERVGLARNYGVVVLEAVTDLVRGLEDDRPLQECWDACRPWQVPALRGWRAAAGFHRAPGGWEQPPLADAHADGPRLTLAQRVAADPDTDPADLEAPHDLLWLADLADALAPFHGTEAATVRHARPAPHLDHEAPSPPGASRSRADSVPLAAAGVAQLVAFGAAPPPRCRDWAELVDGVEADAAVTEAVIARFPVPAEVAAVAGQVVPGTGLTVEIGRDPRQLADWSGYMGNCIGDAWYAEEAARGLCVLMALRADDGRIVANLDVRRGTGGWHVEELKARFNDDLDPALAEPVARWVAALPRADPAADPAPGEPPVRARVGASRRPAAGRLPTDLVRALAAEVERALAAAPAVAARRTYAGLARGLGAPDRPADFDPDAAVVALNRLGPDEHVDLLRAALAAGLGAPAVWRATRVRPLATAVARLDPERREQHRLTALAAGAPLPRTLRALVRRPGVAPAHAMDAVGRAVRGAVGALRATEALARSVVRAPSPELLCALVIATTCADDADVVRLTAPGTSAVPGFPATDALDEHGPWQRALPAAAELGAPAGSFERCVAEHGLLVPAALLGRGGWPALWHRAHR